MSGCVAVRLADGYREGLPANRSTCLKRVARRGFQKARVALDDFRTDYELFSATLPDEHFPRDANWLMLGPSGPRRLRLAVEHLAQYRGGICFCVDLDLGG